MTTDRFRMLDELLQTQSFAPVPFPVSRQAITDMVEGPFYDFLQLPEEVKERLYFKLRPDFRGSDVGYKRRRKEYGDDEKVFFHYHTEAEVRFREEIAMYPALRNLLEAVRPIHRAVNETFHDTLALFAEDFPGILDSFFPTGRQQHLYLRILGYMGSDTLAKNHIDMSGCTLALAESIPGLRIGWDAEHMHHIAHIDGSAIFFPGLTFREETSDAYPPIWHGVEQPARAKYLSTGGPVEVSDYGITRWAVVAFFSGLKLRNPPKEETNTPHPLSAARAALLDGGWHPHRSSIAAVV